MKRFSAICILLLMFMASVGVGDDTCIFPPEQDSDTFVSFVAPAIPPDRTTSGSFAYLALFRPTSSNFWQGDLVKLGLDEDGNFVDANGAPALDSDGNLKASAQPFWALKDWSNPVKSNYIHNTYRKIYTYLGISKDLAHPSNEFKSKNVAITAPILCNPDDAVSEIIDYVRGADVFDEDGDGDTTENRAFILGDIMHSKPLVLTYRYPDNTSQTYVYFGADDGMLHAVLDTETEANGDVTTYGKEVWAFIPPDQLHRLKDMIEGESHSYYVDSSPKAYTIDVDGDGILDKDDGDRIILICGERKGGRSYFALDVTDPREPIFLWRISCSNDAGLFKLPPGARPDVIIPELGRTWSEPVFGRVKTADDDTVGTPVFFIGGGFSATNSAGKAILAISPIDGSVVKRFKNGVAGITHMNFSIPSTVAAIDEDGNGFTDKLYVGDTGGQIWRVGKFTDPYGDPLQFPAADENIKLWTAVRLFSATSAPRRMFFYPPSVSFERGYDLLLIGSGNREDPCERSSAERIYALKDFHDDRTLTEDDLVDVTNPPPVPDFDSETADADNNGFVDRGWFIRLATGEKVLEKGLLFNKVYYVTTFIPDGGQGRARLCALSYKTGTPALFAEEGNGTRSRIVGVGVPSKPVMYIGRTNLKLFISTATPVIGGPGLVTSAEAAILEIQPLAPTSNLFYSWWMVL